VEVIRPEVAFVALPRAVCTPVPSAVNPVPPEPVPRVPASVMVPLDVIGPPDVVSPVEPPTTLTLVTLPVVIVPPNETKVPLIEIALLLSALLGMAVKPVPMAPAVRVPTPVIPAKLPLMAVPVVIVPDETVPTPVIPE